MTLPNIELLAVLRRGAPCYDVIWNEDEEVVYEGIPEPLLDLVPFIVARRLLEWGYNTSRTLVVHLRGADYELMRAPLGAVAATPLVNYANPVKRGAYAPIYKKKEQINDG